MFYQSPETRAFFMDFKHYMKQAISLAEKGTDVFPNPKVGALILDGDTVVAEGYHQVYGGPHAEIEAFNALNQSAKGLTMMVTLEPCSHHGKTPPCVDAIIEKGIQKVIIGMEDPHPLVAGKGIQKLKEAGIEVEIGFLNKELNALNQNYLTLIQKKRPITTLKVATTVDGKVASVTHDSKWISNPSSRLKSHALRERHEAIMVSVNTVLRDDPALSARLESTTHPFKIIIDRPLKTPIDAQLFKDAGGKVIIITHEHHDLEIKKAFLEKGARFIEVPLKENHLDLSVAFEKILDEKIHSVLIEAGHHLGASLIEENLIDELVVFIAPKLIGGDSAPTLMGGKGIALIDDAVKLTLLKHEVLGEDIMLHYALKETSCLQD
jgi:diaminohydroxyphosphoribosylaminopyrimidine deaminase/5-amino-6-(5-phosphoribosylamino)uracil reductase